MRTLSPELVPFDHWQVVNLQKCIQKPADSLQPGDLPAKRVYREVYRALRKRGEVVIEYGSHEGITVRAPGKLLMSRDLAMRVTGVMFERGPDNRDSFYHNTLRDDFILYTYLTEGILILRSDSGAVPPYKKQPSLPSALPL